MKEMNSKTQITYGYLITAAGVIVAVVMAIYSGVRSMVAQANFAAVRPGAGFGGGQFNATRQFNGTRPFNPNQFVGARQFAPGNPFGLVNVVTIIGLIIAVIGLVWLGFALRKVQTSSKN